MTEIEENKGTFIFQWNDITGKAYRMAYHGLEPNGWYKAFMKCGWDCRTTLGIIGDDKKRQIRNGMIKNWWDAMHDKKLYRFNTLYFSGNCSDLIKSGFVQ